MTRSIQAEPRPGSKSSTARLQAATLRAAHRVGVAWDDNEVARIVQGIEKDETSYTMAMALGRTYYGVMGARAHVAFALRHSAAIWGE